jgi:hypothetical protein
MINKKKPWYKKWWIWLIVLAVIGYITPDDSELITYDSNITPDDSESIIYNSEESISGIYSANTGGAITTITVIGNAWFGEHKEEHFGTLLGSGLGTMDSNRILDEYGTKIGYIKNGKAYVNLGGVDATLYKE